MSGRHADEEDGDDGEGEEEDAEEIFYCVKTSGAVGASRRRLRARACACRPEAGYCVKTARACGVKAFAAFISGDLHLKPPGADCF
jgi:hypothetical protein